MGTTDPFGLRFALEFTTINQSRQKMAKCKTSEIGTRVSWATTNPNPNEHETRQNRVKTKRVSNAHYLDYVLWPCTPPCWNPWEIDQIEPKEMGKLIGKLRTMEKGVTGLVVPARGRFASRMTRQGSTEANLGLLFFSFLLRLPLSLRSILSKPPKNPPLTSNNHALSPSHSLSVFLSRSGLSSLNHPKIQL